MKKIKTITILNLKNISFENLSFLIISNSLLLYFTILFNLDSIILLIHSINIAITYNAFTMQNLITFSGKIRGYHGILIYLLMTIITFIIILSSIFIKYNTYSAIFKFPIYIIAILLFNSLLFDSIYRLLINNIKKYNLFSIILFSLMSISIMMLLYFQYEKFLSNIENTNNLSQFLRTIGVTLISYLFLEFIIYKIENKKLKF